jgi:hypothetical protein
MLVTGLKDGGNIGADARTFSSLLVLVSNSLPNAAV